MKSADLKTLTVVARFREALHRIAYYDSTEGGIARETLGLCRVCAEPAHDRSTPHGAANRGAIMSPARVFAASVERVTFANTLADTAALIACELCGSTFQSVKGTTRLTAFVDAVDSLSAHFVEEHQGELK